MGEAVMHETLIALLDHLRGQHDEHMKTAYASLAAGDDIASEQFAYGAGMQHVIRTIETNLHL